MKLKQTHLSQLFLGLTLLYTVSCSVEIAEDDWAPGFAFPLVNSSISIEDMLNTFSTGGFIDVDNDNFITVVYEGEIFSSDTLDLIRVNNFVLPLLDTVQNVSTPSLSNFDIDILTLATGQIFFDFESPFAEDVTVEVTLPQFKDANNNAYTKTINVSNPTGAASVMVLDSAYVGNHTLDFSSGNFSTKYTARLTSNNQGVRMTNFTLNFNNLTEAYIEGYFGNQLFELTSLNFKLDIFNKWQSGAVYFEEPSFEFKFRNSYGFPIRLSSDRLQALTRLGDTIDVVVTPFIDGTDLNFPNLSEVGQAKSTNLIIDKNNSNIQDGLSQAPFGLLVDLAGETNPNMNSSQIGFATSSSKIEIDLKTSLPLHGIADKFFIVDTLELSLGETPSGEAEFKLITDNGFPFDLNLQAYFLDANGFIIDSLFTDPENRLMTSAPIDGNGRATTSTTTIKIVDVTKERLDRLRDATKKVLLYSTFNTINDGNTPIKIFTDNSVHFKIGAIIRPCVTNCID